MEWRWYASYRKRKEKRKKNMKQKQVRWVAPLSTPEEKYQFREVKRYVTLMIERFREPP